MTWRGFRETETTWAWGGKSWPVKGSVASDGCVEDIAIQIGAEWHWVEETPLTQDQIDGMEDALWESAKEVAA